MGGVRAPGVAVSAERAVTALPLGVRPRCLTREQAAEYCACDTIGAFDDWVRRGIVPKAMPGTTKWDRCAIDRALDRRSGLIDDPTTSFDEWAASHAG